jgi:hypothetical protein
LKMSDLVRKFGVKRTTFVEAIRRSPNAQGYIDGAISELLAQRALEKQGFELERIKEKWGGKKLHFGDFYISKAGRNRWYLLESKGLKSNSEEFKHLNNKKNLNRFLKKHNRRLKLFVTDASRRKWVDANFSEDLDELMEHVKVLETHLVAGKGTNRREINTPLKDEFHILCLDLFLRTKKREFIFADPRDLEPSESHPKHLQQNYVVDILLKGIRDRPRIKPPWHRSILEVWHDTRRPVKDGERQVDTRSAL